MILIALGANLSSTAGRPEATLHAALAAMEARGIHVDQVSRFYESEAWPNPSDPPFINAVASIVTHLSPEALLAALQAIETEFGRVRGAPNAPRSLDLDLIDYDGRVQPGPPELPHPRAHTRAFVLLPLSDIAPVWCHPVSGRSVSELIGELPSAKIALLH